MPHGALTSYCILEIKQKYLYIKENHGRGYDKYVCKICQEEFEKSNMAVLRHFTNNHRILYNQIYKEMKKNKQLNLY